METEVWALIIAIISLVVSIWAGYVSRRSAQFQRLSDLRTKATALRWNMHYRLSDVRDAANAVGLLNEANPNNWIERIESLERLLAEAEEREERYRKIYSGLSVLPIIMPESIVEDWHHEVDRIATSVEVSRKELVPKFQESTKKMAELLEQQRELEAELQNAKGYSNQETA